MLLGHYANGNYIVEIYDDGTKFRVTGEDEFNPLFPESIDLKITNYCDIGCPWCHENSNLGGHHADLNAEFINTLHPYTELAIGGGNPLSHPQLKEFLIRLKEKHIIANLTINQKHFIANIDLLKELTSKKLIYGLGISLNSINADFMKALDLFPGAVVHIIAGLTYEEEVEQLVEAGKPILILGYKEFRRGKAVYSGTIEQQIYEMSEWLPKYFKKDSVICFDNLALFQLNIKSKLDKNTWENFYMGDDGQFTMYIDLVEKKYAMSSTSTRRSDIKEDIVPMFKHIRDMKYFDENYSFEAGM